MLDWIDVDKQLPPKTESDPSRSICVLVDMYIIKEAYYNYSDNTWYSAHFGGESLSGIFYWAEFNYPEENLIMTQNKTTYKRSISNKQAIHLVTYADPKEFEYILYVGEEENPYILECKTKFNIDVIVNILKEII